ncbi:hypothetical protein GCM10023170_026310 [Phytohabitans houttuyneae]|uniref:Uncharacterized protein n=1 Tax=Phytohabitans houttuyneae TaxID=1076126 RepID=A0A6V8K0E5_9ACTN|nr:hypothetical protein Phou_012940 [Phytohabitans houttuyneae]
MISGGGGGGEGDPVGLGACVGGGGVAGAADGIARPGIPARTANTPASTAPHATKATAIRPPRMP